MNVLRSLTLASLSSIVMVSMPDSTLAQSNGVATSLAEVSGLQINEKVWITYLAEAQRVSGFTQLEEKRDKEARCVALKEDAIVLEIDGARVEAPEASIKHIGQRAGKKSQKNRIYIGGVIGGFVGAILGAEHCSKYDGSPWAFGISSETCALGGGIAGALLGAGIGAILTKNPHRVLPFGAAEVPGSSSTRPKVAVSSLGSGGRHGLLFSVNF